MNQQRAKVFGIGFHRTATTSLANALERLGYRVKGAVGVHDPDIAENAWPLVLRAAEQYDAFRDNPWPLFYRELDEHFPGSRFILTIRSPDGWLRSMVRYFGSEQTPMREWIYGPGRGSPLGNEQVYLERYERHNRDVQEYFAGRPDDLLVLSAEEGLSWDTLCPFLGLPIPEAPFPRMNPSHAALLTRTRGTLRRLLRRS